MFGNALHAGQGGDLLPGFGDVGRGTAAGVQARIQIAVIRGVGAQDHVVVRVGEQLEAGGLRVKAEKAQSGGALLARRNVDREPLDGDAPLAPAQIGQPDEAEGEHGGGVAIGRAGDGGPPVLAVLQVSAREGGGERVFEIGLGADLGQRPLRKLAPQEEAEALAEHQAAAALAQFRAGAAAQIEQEHLALAAGEMFHGQGEARVGGFGDGGETAAPVARAVPGLEGQARAAHFERVSFRR